MARAHIRQASCCGIRVSGKLLRPLRRTSPIISLRRRDVRDLRRGIRHAGDVETPMVREPIPVRPLHPAQSVHGALTQEAGETGHHEASRRCGARGTQRRRAFPPMSMERSSATASIAAAASAALTASPTARRTVIGPSVSIGYDATEATRRTARRIGQEHGKHAPDDALATPGRFAGRRSAMLSWRRTKPVQSDHPNSSPHAAGRGPSLAKEHFS